VVITQQPGNTTSQKDSLAPANFLTGNPPYTAVYRLPTHWKPRHTATKEKCLFKRPLIVSTSLCGLAMKEIKIQAVDNANRNESVQSKLVTKSFFD